MIIRAMGNYDGFDWTLSTTIFNVDFKASGVGDLVAQTTGMCPNSDLQELVLICHGSGGVINFGSDTIGGISQPGQDPLHGLAPLSSVFVSSATNLPRLILEVCEAGKNPNALLAIANTILHPVYACTGDVHPNLGLTDYGTWDGDTVVTYPGAQSLTNLGQGQQVPPTPTILN
jgi:hypothetical protein